MGALFTTLLRRLTTKTNPERRNLFASGAEADGDVLYFESVFRHVGFEWYQL
jgi:hypothetical protein